MVIEFISYFYNGLLIFLNTSKSFIREFINIYKSFIRV